MDNRAIGIFDSGLGGLTCVKKVMEIMPGENIIYFGDTGRVPYGTRSAQTIVKYVRQDISLLESLDIKFIIIACGTASSAALPAIRDEVASPIIGVLEPACRAAVNASRSGRIGVIGTAGTINSGKYLQTIKTLEPETEVFSRACPMFVPLVENGYTKGTVARIIAEEYLEDIKKQEVDTLILGCTHYPLLREEIQSIMGDSVTLIDSGAEAAIAAQQQLGKLGLLCDRTQGEAQYYVSDTVDGFAELGSVFLNKHIEGSVHRVDIEKY